MENSRRLNTGRYEMYYDTWLGGQYEFKIIELHKQYGPIIRISPWELRIKPYQLFCIVFIMRLYQFDIS